MIKVDILRNPDKEVIEFEISGHAAKGERSLLSWLFRLFNIKKYGNIVCAAVSALSQTTVNSLTEIGNIDLDVEVEDGYLHCKLPLDLYDDNRKIADILIENMLIGISSIEDEYPQYVNITEYENEEV